LPFIDDMAADTPDRPRNLPRRALHSERPPPVASILVPFPHAVDDHQTGTPFLASTGAALLVQRRG
jgi:UDP-N-acetylglucosamine--N-acetylmuramyl-(pentapeptide) pyrophosphoryl-undecaprenol N-acetylglucosamine transferase